MGRNAISPSFFHCSITMFHTETLHARVHTIVPRPLSFRPDFVTAGLVSFGTLVVSCTVLKRDKGKNSIKGVKATETESLNLRI